MRMNPNVHFVGAGPGDPDLLTVKAARLLGDADIVLYDALVGPEILKLVHPGAERVSVGKRAGCASMRQSEINRRLVEAGSRGKCVVRLKGGDPCLFGRLEEEIVALERVGLAFDICPGITAGAAAAAYVGFPLTERGSVRQVAYVTTCAQEGDDYPIDWARLANNDQTLVFYMARRGCHDIARSLIKAGLPAQTPIALISNVSLPQQHVVMQTVSELADGLGYLPHSGPLLLVIGDVLRHRKAMDVAFSQTNERTAAVS